MSIFNVPEQICLGPVKPEWLRLPPSGQNCPFNGLSRSLLNELILPHKKNGWRPPVHSVSIRKRGKLRGVRLVSYESLMAFIASHAEVDNHGQEVSK